jgi:hypothetical protein
MACKRDVALSTRLVSILVRTRCIWLAWTGRVQSFCARKSLGAELPHGL